MSDVFRDAVLNLSHVPGVSGALIVDAQAGVAVVEELKTNVSGTALAALATALYARTAQASEAAEYGSLGGLQLDAERGRVLIASAGELLIVALTQDDAQLGRVRLEAQRAARAVRAELESG